MYHKFIAAAIKRKNKEKITYFLKPVAENQRLTRQREQKIDKKGN